MVSKVNLDAMIPRSDFSAVPLDNENIISGEKLASVSIRDLTSDSPLLHQFRKPDFQRETNHWNPNQIVTFLKSYLDNELVPSLILWRSPSNLFVIDGGHRISALRAWIEDDYGDGTISQKFYLNSIPNEEKKIAERVRKLVKNEIGTYKQIKDASINARDYEDQLLIGRGRNSATRSITVQWVEGDAAKAETSFFKINTQGTPLHKIEANLLRNRRKPIAIAARSIARAGTGNKYWSQFDQEIQGKIESYADELHKSLFKPEPDIPIKTLELPLGGVSSPIGALNTLMDFVILAAAEPDKKFKDWVINQDDNDGQPTIDTLQKCSNLMKRITGNNPASLGLHPAVYFYNHRGKHSEHFFLSIIGVFNIALQNNNSDYFKKFTKVRGKVENFLIKNKPLINQAVVHIGSTKRVERLREMFIAIITSFSENKDFNSNDLLEVLKLKGKLIASDLHNVGSDFSSDSKSAILLNQSIEQAVKCPICKGLIDSKSISYDHIKRKREGGSGEACNGQLTHPYCNSAIKN